jgi:AraC-like DNA-binding protein/mannose-6-phosphate isomerase-like protein (cupin superfamily)
MTGILAKGENYFEDPAFPITARRVSTSRASEPSHEHDLTEVQHAHDFNELAIVTAGTAMHWLNGSEFPVVAGDVFLLQGQQDHYFHKRDRLEMVNVMYDPQQIELPESRLLKMPGYCALFLLEPVFRKQHRFSSRLHLERLALSRAERIALEMVEEVESRIDGYESALLGKLIDLMVFLSRSYQKSESANSAALLRVGQVISSMEQDCAHDWKLEDFIEMSRLSRSHFIRTFAKATRLSPIEYLIQLRLQRAMELLRHSQLTVSQIAFEVGFNDSNYFARQFKQRKGASPLAYRKSFGGQS